jgi:hypothetical protein
MYNSLKINKKSSFPKPLFLKRSFLKIEKPPAENPEKGHPKNQFFTIADCGMWIADFTNPLCFNLESFFNIFVPKPMAISDCGLRIADFKTTLKSAIRNPQSEIPLFFTSFEFARFFFFSFFLLCSRFGRVEFKTECDFMRRRVIGTTTEFGQ